MSNIKEIDNEYNQVCRQAVSAAFLKHLVANRLVLDFKNSDTEHKSNQTALKNDVLLTSS